MICRQCPRLCGVERNEGEGHGFCQMPEVPVAARAALHHWEEPPISGSRGAGTVFFSGCVLRCIFCQNYAISHEGVGKPLSVQQLRRVCDDLIKQGAHNIELVNPTHFSSFLADFLETPLGVPVVWNSGGYERVETLKALAGKVDIYLPDLKYLCPGLSKKYSGVEDYPAVATAAIREMAEQTGPPVFDGDGLLVRGTVIRHLVLPGHVNEAKAVMDWVAASFPKGAVLFSLMSQYTPFGRAQAMPGLDRKLYPGEIRGAQRYMAALELPGFVQEAAAAGEGFIPAFDGTGIRAFSF